MSIADEIAKLHELQSRGALMQEEFEKAKARLLDSAPGPGARLAWRILVLWIFVPREQP